MTEPELIVEYHLRCKNEVELPLLAEKQRLLEELAAANPENHSGQKAALGGTCAALTRLAQQLLHAGHRLSGGVLGLSDWNRSA
jgi:hypothetical protein